MNRSIEINVSIPDCQQSRKAIEYLVSWSIDHYDKMFICDDFPYPGKNMIASYKNTLNESTYVIGAIWNEDKQAYSFHS